MEKMGWRRSLVTVGGAVIMLGSTGIVWAGETPAGKSEQTTVEPPKVAEKDWVDRIKQPTDWFKWGADERIRHTYIDNPFFLDVDPPGDDWNFNRFRTRVWGTAEAAENVSINARLTWEARYWWEPDSKPDPASDNDGPWDWSDVVIDNLNVKIGGIAGEDSVLVVGRQDIILGNGWLVLEGTPLDGSRTIFFDAVRLTVPFQEAKTSVDAIYIEQFSDPDKWLPPINSRSYPANTEQDERGAILWVTNKSIERTEINGFFIYKHDEPEQANGDEGDIYTLGSRIVHEFNPHWSTRVEGAYQFGNRENPALFGANADDDLSAWGINSWLAYSFKDNWKNQLFAAYEFLSGDDPDSSKNTQFDPLWGRWPQWSELYIYSYASETRIAEVTNLHRLSFGWISNPTDKMTLQATYNLLWADELTREEQGALGFGGSHFRGQLFTALLRYRFNRFFSGHLLAEYFVPGNFYEDEFPRNDDDAAFLRGELVFTF